MSITFSLSLLSFKLGVYYSFSWMEKVSDLSVVLIIRQIMMSNDKITSLPTAGYHEIFWIGMNHYAHPHLISN